MIERDHDELPAALREAARVLRASPMASPSDVWRQRLLRAIAAAPKPVSGARPSPDGPRRWSIRPATAIAAGLACVLIGGATAVLAPGVLHRPSLPVVAAQPSGGTESLVRFSYVAPTATQVFIVGDFNGWNPSALPLQRSSDGRTWEVEIPLAPGRYAYSFVVDGALARDPSAPRAGDDDFGSANSILMVRGS